MKFCHRSGNILCGLVALLFAAGSAGAENTGVWRHHERQAPSENIGNIFALPDGRIAAGSQGSLHFFDRVKWEKKVFDSSLLSSHVPLFADSEGKLYFNSNNRLAVLNGATVTVLDSGLYEPASFVERGDTVYIGMYDVAFGGLFACDGQHMEKITSARIRSLAVDQSGTLWATGMLPGGSSTRLLVWENGGWIDRTSEIESMLPAEWGEIELRVYVAPDGNVWVIYYGSYGTLINGVWSLHKNPGGGYPYALAFDKQGGVWGYTAHDKMLYLLSTTSGKWVGSKSYGTYRTNDPGFLTVTPDLTMFTSDGDSLYQYTGTAWKGVEDPYDLGSDQVTTVAYLGDKIICGHGFRERSYDQQSNRGLSIYDGNSWTNLKHSGDNKFENVFLVKESPNNDVFIYSDYGCYFYDGENFTAVVDTISWYSPTDVRWGSDGAMWITTAVGMVQYFGPDYEQQFICWNFSDTNPGVCNLAIDDRDDLYMQFLTNKAPGTALVWRQGTTDSLYTLPPQLDLNDIDVTPDGTIWGARVTRLSYWNALQQEWNEVTAFSDSNRIVQIDDSGRIWASSLGKTGYYANGTFTAIPDLSGIAANSIAFSGGGGVLLNAFDKERTTYYGIYAYDPSDVGVEEPDQPIPFLVGKSYPNPFNPAVTIQFALPAAGMVRVQVYNITGQRVKTLASRVFPAGVNQVVWDSTTDSGTRASSGVYFYRLEAGKQVYSGKMTLMR